jgi:hypothetical protein
MRFRPSFWFPIAAVVCAINVVWAWIAMRSGPMGGPHAAGHAIAAVGFGFWALTLRNQLKLARQQPARAELPEHMEQLEAEMDSLRQQLIETQERLDFTERMLAQRLDADRAKEPR